MVDVVVFKCVVCGKAFIKVQSLRAHLKVHRDVEFENFTVRIPKAKAARFREICRQHNTTTCHLILTLMDAVEEGVKTGLVKIGGANPVAIQVVTMVNARPRGHEKYDFFDARYYEDTRGEKRCVVCGQPAVVEGVYYDSWRAALCKSHRWLKTEFEVWRKIGV